MARKLGIGILLAVTLRLYFRNSVPTFRVATPNVSPPEEAQLDPWFL